MVLNTDKEKEHSKNKVAGQRKILVNVNYISFSQNFNDRNK